MAWLHSHVFFLSHLPGGAELTRPPLPLSPEVPLVVRLSPVTVTMASVPVYQAKLENHEGHSKQMSQFQPNAQTRQTQPTTLQPTPNPHIEGVPEPLTTFPPELQKKSEPQEKTQPSLQTHVWSPPKPEPHLQSVHQTTLQPQYEPKSQPTTNHHSLPPTQSLLMTQNELQAQFQPDHRATLMISHQTIQPTPQNTPRIQERPPGIPTNFQLQPETSSYFRPQIHTQHSLTKPGKLSPKPRVKNQEEQMIIQTHHQSHSPSRSPFQITLPPKEYPASGPHPKLQPSIQSEPQTRTQADHSKDTPVKAVHKGKDPSF